MHFSLSCSSFHLATREMTIKLSLVCPPKLFTELVWVFLSNCAYVLESSHSQKKEHIRQFAVRYPLFRKGSEKVFGNVTENLLTFFTVTSNLFCLDVGYCPGKRIFL